MKKLRILCDIDGIVANTLPYWLRKIAKKTGYVAQVEDIKEWDLCKAEPLLKANRDDIYALLNESYFMAEAPVMFGAKQAVRKLTDDGHEICFVTARTGHKAIPETFEWFHRHFPYVNTERALVFLYDKHHLNGDVLIDDKPTTLEAYKAVRPGALTVGIKYPYNSHLGPEHKLFGSAMDATLTWGSIYACITNFAETIENRGSHEQ